ncbi:MAG TPA: acyl-CoA dehydrogenase family protein [Casimicrobiaceae bacterium]|nr:acyl-CoA dehydrogenase family protein [Casimicrobiaceae bacterium]
MNPPIPGDVRDLRERIRRFVQTELVPLEGDPGAYDDHENIDLSRLQALRAKAKAQQLWALQMPRERGGRGLPMSGLAVCYEEMSQSIFGPVVFNAAAPDDGNMIVLERVATDAQKQKWLQPIVDGAVRSSIVMTEPMPGAGSDPTMMRTTAERKGDRWVIRGSKWFITGAGIAQHFLLLARTSDDRRKGLTAFMFHRDTPGWEIVRRIPIMGPEEHGGHCELRFDGLEIPDEDRLLGVGDGLKVVQIRLGRARLTHCMRWLGLSRKALNIALSYVTQREAQGSKLVDREGVRWLLADAATDIHTGRLLVMDAATKLDGGDFARKEISMAKVTVANALQHAVDTAIQLCGARGYSNDTPLSWIYRYARQARLVDGATEVHKGVIASFLVNDGDAFRT